MISKQELLECSVENFTKFGSKRFTMDELAFELGISKKTIYSWFETKEDLVSESLSFLTNKFKREVEKAISECKDPIEKIIIIYEIGFHYFEWFNPSFIFGLRKYYPKARNVFETFRNDFVYGLIYKLLITAKEQLIIRPDVNLKLICDLYFVHIENLVYKPNNFFDSYTKKELVKHLIINNLRGITNTNYSNIYFD